jgi:hypothetical protein
MLLRRQRASDSSDDHRSDVDGLLDEEAIEFDSTT